MEITEIKANNLNKDINTIFRSRLTLHGRRCRYTCTMCADLTVTFWGFWVVFEQIE